MSLSNASESDVLDVVLEGTDPAWRAGATGYLALVTGASVDEANPLANECTYTGYARIAQTKATAWSGSGNTRTNANLLQWGKRTDAGATLPASARRLAPAPGPMTCPASVRCWLPAPARAPPTGNGFKPRPSCAGPRKTTNAPPRPTAPARPAPAPAALTESPSWPTH